MEGEYKLKIGFLVGNDREKCLYRCLGAGIKVDFVIANQTHNGRLDSWKRACELLDIPLLIIESNKLESIINGFNPHVIVSIGYPKLIDQSILSTVDIALNVHPTLLPKYKGAHSGWYVLANGEKESGVTIHELDETLDGGDIIMQEKFEITPFDNILSFYKKSRELESNMLVKVLQQIIKGEQLVKRKQDKNQETIYKKLRTPEDSEIDPKRSLIELINPIRACHPELYPAFFMHEGKKVFVNLWIKDEGN